MDDEPRYDAIGRVLVPRTVIRMVEPLGNWTDDALCKEIDPELWFPPEGEAGGGAKAVCGMCDVRTECLRWALENGERHGIWGGLSPNQRAKLRRKGHAA